MKLSGAEWCRAERCATLFMGWMLRLIEMAPPGISIRLVRVLLLLFLRAIRQPLVLSTRWGYCNEDAS